MNKQSQALTSQNAFILLFTLIILAVVSLLVVAALDFSGLEQKMAANFRQHALAFQAVDSAIKVAENSLPNGGGSGTGNVGKSGHYQIIQVENEECQSKYLIKAVGQFANARSEIESVYIQWHIWLEACKLDTDQRDGRQTWREINRVTF